MVTGGKDAGAVQRRPVGILAALLAVGIIVGGLMAGQAYALRLAERNLATVASGPLPIKYDNLTFQRAAFAVTGELPMYGSSELFCCGQPDLPTQFFANAPAGFHPFAIGRAGTGDLMFLETFGALGSAVRGKRVVVSVSPQWFYGSRGITAGYNGTFSPEIAEVFTYDAPLPMPLREAAAAQMAAHPSTLAGQGLLSLGVHALASGNLPLYYALLPVGRLDAWAHQIKDAWRTVAYLASQGRGAAAGVRPGHPARSRVQQVAAASAGRGGRDRVGAAAGHGGRVTLATEGVNAGSLAGLVATLRNAVVALGQAVLREPLAPSAPPAHAVAPASRVPSGSLSASDATSGSLSAGRSSRPPARGTGASSGSAAAARVNRSPIGVLTTAPVNLPLGAPPTARPLLAALTRKASGPPAGAPIPWLGKLAAATGLENTLAGSDPFGFFMNRPSLHMLEPALRLYCAGVSNAAGGVYPFPTGWARTMAGSAEWTDLGLEMQALRDLGARALVWTIPFQGYYDNYTQLSRPARQVYYRRFLQVTAPSGFPAVTFVQADGDRLFIANTGNHFSPRGWVVADRVLTLFWHGQTGAIPGAIAAMTHAVPPPPPVRTLACPNPGGITRGGARTAE